uniref:ArsR family transcriptional regulator n=1 Tax=Geobacter sp. (strain M21) TaxID=443144 RepID=C6E6T2_GEOSM
MDREAGSIHYARFIKSDRLQRLLLFMLDGKAHTTLEIIKGADICAVNSAVCELRRNGFACYCISRSKPASYQLTDPAGARKLMDQLLGAREVVNG